jgi:hypothetical protein
MDQGETLAIGIEKSFIGLENMGNLTKMVPGLVDVSIIKYHYFMTP